MARWSKHHFMIVTALGPQEVELEHSKVVVSRLLSFHVLFRNAPTKSFLKFVSQLHTHLRVPHKEVSNWKRVKENPHVHTFSLTNRMVCFTIRLSGWIRPY